MRAFVAVRRLLTLPPSNPVHELQREVKELKEYIEEVFAGYNDINDDTRMQLELINQTLAELQAKKHWQTSRVILLASLPLRRNKKNRLPYRLSVNHWLFACQ